MNNDTNDMELLIKLAPELDLKKYTSTYMIHGNDYRAINRQDGVVQTLISWKGKDPNGNYTILWSKADLIYYIKLKDIIKQVKKYTEQIEKETHNCEQYKQKETLQFA